MNGTRNKILIGSLIVVSAIAAGAWGLSRSQPKDAGLEEIKQLAAAPPNEANREAMREAIERRTADMTNQQKGEFFAETMAPVFMPLMAKRFSDDYDKLMAMSPEDRQKELDRRIDAMMAFRPPPGQQAGPPPGAPPFDPQKFSEMRAKMLDWITPDQRAKFDTGFKMMLERMKERGVQPPGGGWITVTPSK